MDKEQLYQYLLHLGDNSMILGQRLGEYCGHGPELETDIALTNVSLDLFGQVRNYFQYAASLKDGQLTEDDVAMLRYEHEYLNCLLVEQPNNNFAYILCRQFLFDVYHKLLLERLLESTDETIRAVAAKSIKEVEYHLDLSSNWIVRLGDGTEVSKEKIQEAVDNLWQFSMEMFQMTAIEAEAAKKGVGPDLNELKSPYMHKVQEVFAEATLSIPSDTVFQYGGKSGRHSEYMGYLLADFQFMQRAYPNMKW